MSLFAKPMTNEPKPVGYGIKNRVLPRAISTGSTKGTQTVGYGNTKIDGSNNRIVVANPDTGETIGFGSIPDTEGEFGFFSINSDGVLTYKVVNGALTMYDEDGTSIFSILNGTIYMYDATSGVNTLQLGKLPDGTTNLAIAKAGQDVTEAF